MKAFITVIGHDTVGVVAKVAGLCTELNINIEDVTQSILQGMFAPTEISISAVTAVFGAPVVLWLLVRRGQEGVR